MAIKRVFLPLYDAGNIQPLVEAAFVVGRMLSAQVRAFLAQPIPVVLPSPPPGLVSADTIRQIIENAREEQENIERKVKIVFEDCIRFFPQVEQQFVTSTEAVGKAVSHGARLADISVLGSGAHFGVGAWGEIREAAIFGSGRPVLLVPAGQVAPESFEKVVIAWRDSIEAARAVAAAQPFLMHAAQVHLVTVSEDAPTAAIDQVEQYLQLHYADIQSEIIPPQPEPLGETLLRKSESIGGALMVMGAYSHSRWQERMFGGATEYMLREARVPVLMAH
jgi:nucleotide-binding universal stress UspA family protein